MDAIAGPGDRQDATSRAPHADPVTNGRLDAGLVDDPPSSEETDGQGTPQLTLEGFCGPLDHLLSLARTQTIDLTSLSLTALVDQLATALRQAPAAVPLSQKGDWVVMAAWLVQLRTRLLLPAETPAHQQAERDAAQLREHLVGLQAMQALAGWLARRPQLGHDVFGRGRPPSRAQSPEAFGVSVEAGQAIDVIEFLWASLAQFDDEPVPDTANVYHPRPFALYGVAEARARILRLLGETPDGASLERFLPNPPEMATPAVPEPLRRRSAWSSTFVAGLELAKQGEVVLGQGVDFQAIHVRPAPSHRCDSGSNQSSLLTCEL